MGGRLAVPHIVVVGAGTAGLAVAIEAAVAGARVTLLEKQDTVGGMLHVASGEFSGAGTRRQAARGIDDDPRRHHADVMRLSHGQAHPELSWLSVSRQGTTVDWLESLGFDFNPGTPGFVHGHEVYPVPRTYWGVEYGRSLARLLSRELDRWIAAGRVTVLLGARAEGLLRDRDGRVTGVSAVLAGGATVRVEGAAVVLATGGYDANRELRNRFLPPDYGEALIACLPHATGDGLRLAESVGANVTSRGFFLPVMGLIPDPARPGFAVDYREAFVQLPPAYRVPHEIWVNSGGQRFVAEDTDSPEHRERALLRQPGLAMHIIWDRAIADAAEPLLANGAGDWTTARMAAELGQGRWVVSAPTVSDLGRILGTDPATLAATVQRYNAAVASGHDPDHGRKIMPMPIGVPPYYALTSVAASLLSRDGVPVNTDLAVLGPAGEPIGGLYAVGEILGNNVFAGDNYVGGMSVTPALTLGRLLGATLAAGLAGTEC